MLAPRISTGFARAFDGQIATRDFAPRGALLRLPAAGPSPLGAVLLVVLTLLGFALGVVGLLVRLPP